MALKRGLKYPLQIVNGGLALATDFALVEDHIVSVLETRPRERVMRADYGFDPKIFDTMEPNAINARIARAVENQVPEVANLEVRGNVAGGDGGTYQVTLKYTVDGVPAPPLSLTLNI